MGAKATLIRAAVLGKDVREAIASGMEDVEVLNAAEAIRASTDGTKAAAEAARVVQESDRVTKDTGRTTAEAARVTDYASLKGIMINENNAVDLQNQINGHTSSLASNVQQLGLKRDITSKIKDTDMDTSTNANKLKPINMSDELMAMFSPAGTVSPVIPDGGVGTTHYANNSITNAKMGIAYQNGYIAGGGKVDIDVNTKTVSITSTGAMFVVGNFTVIGVAPATLTYTNTGFNYVFYNLTSGLFLVDGSGIAGAILNKDNIFLFSFYPTMLKVYAFNTNIYTIDGIKNGGFSDGSVYVSNNSITDKKMGTTYLRGEIIEGSISINTSNKTVTILKNSAGRLLTVTNIGIYSLGETTLTYTNTGLNYVYIDITTWSAILKDGSSVADVLTNKNLVFLFSFYPTALKVYTSNRELYTIDGLINGGWASQGTIDGTIYDTTTARIVMPDKLYLLKDTPYSILGMNVVSPLRLWDSAKVSLEIPLLSDVQRGSSSVNILVNEECTLNTQLAIESNQSTNVLLKKLSVKVKDRKNIVNPVNPVRVCCIGDSLTNSSLPLSVKWWLNKLGVPSTMVGTITNDYVYDYPFPDWSTDVADAKGEGYGGYWLTDFVDGLKFANGADCIRPTAFYNPTSKTFDAQYYLQQHTQFTGFDFVTIALGTNDISGSHALNTVGNPTVIPTLAQIIAYFPVKLDVMIASFKATNPNVKIAIIPPHHTGITLSFGEKYRTLIDALVTYYKDREDVIILGTYLSIGQTSSLTYFDRGLTPYSAQNNTLICDSASGNIHFNGQTQMSNACWIASWIANML